MSSRTNNVYCVSVRYIWEQLFLNVPALSNYLHAVDFSDDQWAKIHYRETILAKFKFILLSSNCFHTCL